MNIENTMYILDQETKQIKKVTYNEWSDWIKDTKNKILKQTEIENLLVSTVFLSSDHNFDRDCDNSKPILFETMIFSNNGITNKNPEYDFSGLDYQKRYSTYEEAMQGHSNAIEWVKEYLSKQHNQGYEFENGPIQVEEKPEPEPKTITKTEHDLRWEIKNLEIELLAANNIINAIDSSNDNPKYFNLGIDQLVRKWQLRDRWRKMK